MHHQLAVLTDFPEERWPSVDLCGDMLTDNLPGEGPFAVEAARLCTRFGGPFPSLWAVAVTYRRAFPRLGARTEIVVSVGFTFVAPARAQARVA